MEKAMFKYEEIYLILCETMNVKGHSSGQEGAVHAETVKVSLDLVKTAISGAARGYSQLSPEHHEAFDKFRNVVEPAIAASAHRDSTATDVTIDIPKDVLIAAAPAIARTHGHAPSIEEGNAIRELSEPYL